VRPVVMFIHDELMSLVDDSTSPFQIRLIPYTFLRGSRVRTKRLHQLRSRTPKTRPSSHLGGPMFSRRHPCRHRWGGATCPPVLGHRQSLPFGQPMLAMQKPRKVENNPPSTSIYGEVDHLPFCTSRKDNILKMKYKSPSRPIMRIFYAGLPKAPPIWRTSHQLV